MEKHTLAFEIGTEEIPAFDLNSATGQMERNLSTALKNAGIPFDEVKVLTSPRRIISLVEGIADAIPAKHEEFKGPKCAIAFDAEGNPTKAAIGFARGKGFGPEALSRREVDGDEYVFVTVDTPEKPVIDMLPELLGFLIPQLNWPRSCRWGRSHVTFSRPVRWLVALLDEKIVPVSFGDLCADRLTYGHRVLAPGTHEVDTAAHLLDVVRAAGVVPSMAEREKVIRDGIAAIEAQTGSTAQTPEKTMLEVVNLTEYPTPLMGVFDEEFLQVPEEIIVDAMLMHQRYFPLYDAAGKLTNRFIIVSNGDPAWAATIVDGNERVVRARLDDAKFFYEEDLKKPLEAYVSRLDDVVFQEKLGTVRDKTNRLVQLATHLSASAGLDAADSEDLSRALFLCKADLVTNAVVEFTSVQGVMGSYYARAAGESEQVVGAIAQQYQPRFAGDAAPDTTVGKLTAFADKLDTICGLFAIGQAPSGSKDPFALRRSAIGIVNMLIDGLPVSLVDAVDASLATFAGLEFDRTACRDEVLEFFITRTKVIMRDGGCSADAVDAVLAGGVMEPAEIAARTRALEAARAESPEVMENLAIAYARANNLREAELGSEIDESFLDEVSHALVCAVNQADRKVSLALDDGDYTSALSALAELRKPIDLFFDRVKVMDDDASVRDNNLRLLNRFVSVFAHVADFGKLAPSRK